MRKPSRSVSAGAASGVLSTFLASVIAAGSLVLSTLVGAFLLATFFAVIGVLNYVLAQVGLMVNPALAVILVAMVTILGLFAAVNLFCWVQLRLLGRLHRWGLRNRYPELTCLVSVFLVIGTSVGVAWYVAAGLGEPAGQLLRWLPTLFGLAACVVAPKFIIDVNEKIDGSLRYESLRTFFFGPYPERLEEDHDVGGLLAALRDGNEFIRARAAASLGRVGDERAVPALQEALQCEFNYAKSTVALALVKIGGENAMKSLMDETKLDFWLDVWSEVARGRKLGRFPEMPDTERSVVARLVEIANSDAEEWRRKWAKEMLVKLGPGGVC
ncbi:MAG: HEAT repeat domain-containing protein [Pirellulaceae bacterium]